MTTDALHAGRAAWHAHLAKHDCCRQHGTICPTCREALRGKRGRAVVALRVGVDVGLRLVTIAIVAAYAFDLPQAVAFAKGAAGATVCMAFVAWRLARRW